MTLCTAESYADSMKPSETYPVLLSKGKLRQKGAIPPHQLFGLVELTYSWFEVIFSMRYGRLGVPPLPEALTAETL